MEPFFYAPPAPVLAAPTYAFAHGGFVRFAFVPGAPGSHKGATRLRLLLLPGRVLMAVRFGARPEGLAHPLERGLFV